ncbi:MAG TPA: PAS domain S-box protein, partial [Chitinophagaceae bacterium]|nr:PAS domain S-box protein [Chitinophagaceae bacterium]
MPKQNRETTTSSATVPAFSGDNLFAQLHEKLKENEFYKFTFDHLREAVFWVDQNGKIWQVNEGAVTLSGYTKEDLENMNVADVNMSVQREDFPAVWARLREQKRVVMEAKFKRKDKQIIDIEITQNFLVFEGVEYTCSIVRDIRKRKLEENLLRTVSEATSSLTGNDFLVELAKHVTITLSMRYALITECANEEGTRLRTLC